MQRRHVYAAITLSLALAAIATWAGVPPSFTIPFSFTAHSPAKASEVNANFTTLENQIQYLNLQLVAQQTTINNLHAQLSTVQSNTVLQLDGKLGLGDDPATGQPTARFTSVNVQIVNGTDTTDGGPNGLGNLIIGYNEADPAFQNPFCSYGGDYDNQSDCEGIGGVWGADQRSGSHNLVLGYGNAYSSYGGLIDGKDNIINMGYAAVTGGTSNIASGFQASVSGGDHNKASGMASSISGGRFNVASGLYSSVSGGGSDGGIALGNKALGNYSSVSGGTYNWAGGDYASVSGGNDGSAEGDYSSVSGGYWIYASTSYKWCGGGTHSAPNCH